MTDPKSLGDQPAFPELHIHHWKDAVGDCSVPRWNGGLTKREWLSGLAMQGICRDPNLSVLSGLPRIAEIAVNMADALLSELAKETK